MDKESFLKLHKKLKEKSFDVYLIREKELISPVGNSFSEKIVALAVKISDNLL